MQLYIVPDSCNPSVYLIGFAGQDLWHTVCEVQTWHLPQLLGQALASQVHAYYARRAEEMPALALNLMAQVVKPGPL
jgi:hypothetical protein